MIRVCTELEKKTKEQAELIDSLGGDECYVFTHPARSILGTNNFIERADGRGRGGRPRPGHRLWRLPSRRIDRIIGDIIINGRTYCLPSRYYLGGKMLMPVASGRGEGMCVWFGREDREKLLLEMGDMPSALTGGWSMNDAKKKIYDYLAEKE